jgi:co-chaperonin GroES (HSP10)|tara:strand:- start:1747 stop:2025 length:279 start_codon:yes stop_codon:yes gene_type:complete
MASINFKPTRDWVVLPMQRKDKTDSGIELVGGAENSLRTNILKVIAAGPQCQMVKEGDTVMVHPTSEGLVINLDEGEFVMVNEFTICGVIPD